MWLESVLRESGSWGNKCIFWTLNYSDLKDFQPYKLTKDWKLNSTGNKSSTHGVSENTSYNLYQIREDIDLTENLSQTLAMRFIFIFINAICEMQIACTSHEIYGEWISLSLTCIFEHYYKATRWSRCTTDYNLWIFILWIII